MYAAAAMLETAAAMVAILSRRAKNAPNDSKGTRSLQPAVPAGRHERQGRSPDSHQRQQNCHGAGVGDGQYEGDHRDQHPRTVRREVCADGEGLAQARSLDEDEREDLEGLHEERQRRHDADLGVVGAHRQRERHQEPARSEPVRRRSRDGLPHRRPESSGPLFGGERRSRPEGTQEVQPSS